MAAAQPSLFPVRFPDARHRSRILFDNSNRIELFGLFAFILGSALVVGLLYGGKTWCNYFCPISVIQDIYTGPGGLLDSKAHLTPARVSLAGTDPAAAESMTAELLARIETPSPEVEDILSGAASGCRDRSAAA
jgi:4Fe-4S binding domain